MLSLQIQFLIHNLNFRISGYTVHQENFKNYFSSHIKH